MRRFHGALPVAWLEACFAHPSIEEIYMRGCCLFTALRA